MFTLKRTACLVALVWALPGQAAMTIQPDPQNSGGYVIAAADLARAAQAKTANPMYGIWSKALATRPNSVVEAIVARAPGNPDNVKRVERVFTESDWDFLTQMAAPEYTYERFLRAVGKFPAFCGDYTDGRNADAICKKSIITAFAHFAQETGGHIGKENVSDNPLGLEEWQQALVHVREMGWSEGQTGYTTGCGQNDWQNTRVAARTTGRTGSGRAVPARAISAVVPSSSPTTSTTVPSRRPCLAAMPPCSSTTRGWWPTPGSTSPPPSGSS